MLGKKSYENLKNITRQRSATFFQYKDIMNENRNEVKKSLRELIIQLIADNKVELFYFRTAALRCSASASSASR